MENHRVGVARRQVTKKPATPSKQENSYVSTDYSTQFLVRNIRLCMDNPQLHQAGT